MLKRAAERVRGRLTVRIFLITTLLLLCACGLTYGFIAWSTPITYQSVAFDALSEQLDALQSRLKNVRLEDSGPLFDRFIRDSGSGVRLTDERGDAVELPITVENPIPDGSIAAQESAESGVTVASAFTDGESAGALESRAEAESNFAEAESAAVTVTGSDWESTVRFLDGQQEYTLWIYTSATAVNQAVEAMRKVLPGLVLVVLCISLLGAVVYSRYITRPIVRLSEISRRMADLDFSWACGEKRSDEIGTLGRSLDELSRRLSGALGELKTANAALQADIDRERALERQRSEFFSAASHELKTPITVLKGQLSGMLAGVDVYRDRDKYLARSLAVTGRMETLVREMLEISRMERRETALPFETLDLSALVRGQLALAEDLAVQREQRMETEIAEGVRAAGNRALLEQAVSSLLNNALTYSPPGSRVSVGLSQAEDGSVLTVENSGVQIPPQALPHLFEAFYRVETSRSRNTGGSGLGLYLTRMILDRHGARCAISNRPNGVAAEVRFPLAP